MGGMEKSIGEGWETSKSNGKFHQQWVRSGENPQLMGRGEKRPKVTAERWAASSSDGGEGKGPKVTGLGLETCSRDGREGDGVRWGGINGDGVG